MKDVIVFDAQDITRIGIETLLNSQKKYMPAQVVESKAALLKMLAEYPQASVILDYSLADFAGADDLLNVSSRFPSARWLLFSEELSNDFVSKLTFSSEAFSIVLKMCDADEINAALSFMLRGERFICARVANQLLQVQKHTPAASSDILTATEKEILKEIASGHTTREIASNRNLSFHTITTHRKNIFRKLEVNNIHEATRYAVRAGLVDLADYYI